MVSEITLWFQQLPWDSILKVGYILYIIFVIIVCVEMLMNTRTGSKTLAYLALVALVPVLGIIFYLSFGINYRKNKIYSRKILKDDRLAALVQDALERRFNETSMEHRKELDYFYPLAKMIQEDNNNVFSADNAVDLLINGEHKFDRLLEDLKNAKEHIHIEYYIFEDDAIGNEICETLIQKHKEGVTVKFIYDDFGSRSIRKSLSKKLIAAGIPCYPFYKIKLVAFANRLNYRNHRKIVVIDNKIGYVGGINVSDKYINRTKDRKKLFWRDTHLRIEGLAVLNLQTVFLSDWQFCVDADIENISQYFPRDQSYFDAGDVLVQTVSSGPDSNYPSILYAINRAILLSKKSVWITTPYFIPDETLKNALIMAALSGIDVRLLVPGVSDSAFVNTCASANYEDLLEVGVKIFLYQKGFVHAKTMVCDGRVAFVGTANLDQRSFDLNFEINTVVYNAELAKSLQDAFLNDMEGSKELIYSEWIQRPKWMKLIERVLNLFSPLM